MFHTLVSSRHATGLVVDNCLENVTPTRSWTKLDGYTILSDIASTFDVLDLCVTIGSPDICLISHHSSDDEMVSALAN